MHILAAIATEAIPELRLPKGPLPPWPWEQSWPLVLLGCLSLAVLIAWWIWKRTSCIPSPEPAPEASARLALENLLHQTRDNAIRDGASCIVRQYLLKVSGLSPGATKARATLFHAAQALTTEELLNLLGPSPFSCPELGVSIGEFLGDCDRQTYSAGAGQEGGRVMVERARSLLEQVERQRIETHAPPASAAKSAGV